MANRTQASLFGSAFLLLGIKRAWGRAWPTSPPAPGVYPDPDINIARVQQRVAEGGHDVPGDKIVQRYGRSIALLGEACDASNRAYIFDNSGEQHMLIAEVTDGETMTLHADTVPQWLAATSLWQSFQPGGSAS